MKLLVTGREGQVARSIAELASGSPDIDAVLAGRPDFDLTDPERIAAVIEAARPDVVVSAAAYTAVDKAEDEPDLAFAANATGAGLVAAAAARAGAPVIHLSTDYVFSGEKRDAYVEADLPDPRNVYGRSKLAGETAVAAANERFAILRTSWVYSPFGRNFVKTMLGLAATRDKIGVVCDQWGNPTSAADIAEGVLRTARALTAGVPDASGVFHLAGSGSTSWSGLARHVLAESAKRGGPFADVEDITTADYPTKAARPMNSRLSCSRFESVFGWRTPAWQDAASAVVARLLA